MQQQQPTKNTDASLIHLPALTPKHAPLALTAAQAKHAPPAIAAAPSEAIKKDAGEPRFTLALSTEASHLKEHALEKGERNAKRKTAEASPASAPRPPLLLPESKSGVRKRERAAKEPSAIDARQPLHLPLKTEDEAGKEKAKIKKQTAASLDEAPPQQDYLLKQSENIERAASAAAAAAAAAPRTFTALRTSQTTEPDKSANWWEGTTLTNLIKKSNALLKPLQTESMPAESTHLTVKALVSSANSEEVLLAQVMLAGKQETAHFDTCATHCFVSKRFARRLAQRGHEERRSSVVFDVSQGNPLCSTRSILYLRLSIVREDGRVCTWSQCLFIVADAGADLIIAKAILDKGDIVKYRPPADYVHMLQDCERANPTPQPNRDQDASTAQQDIIPSGTVTVTSYAEPDWISPEEGPLKGTKNLKTIKDETSTNNHEKLFNLGLPSETKANVSANSEERELIFLPELHETVEPAKGTHIPPGQQ